MLLLPWTAAALVHSSSSRTGLQHCSTATALQPLLGSTPPNAAAAAAGAVATAVTAGVQQQHADATADAATQHCAPAPHSCLAQASSSFTALSATSM